MTTSQAFTVVEAALTEIGLIDRDGEPLIGIMAVPMVARYAAGEWEWNEDAFASGAITPAQYAEGQTQIIGRLRRRRMGEQDGAA